MRLIDADYLENMGYELHRTYQQDANTMVYEVKKIADVPTIEIEPNSCEYWDSESHFCALHRPQTEPVRRGQWIYKGDDTFAGEYACSYCNGRAEVDLYGQWILSNYCPNCGAKMEKGEERWNK